MLPLKFVIFLLSAAAMVWGVLNWPLSPGGDTPNQGALDATTILGKLNSHRQALAAPLKADPELVEWMDAQIPPTGMGSPPITASLLLERLQEEVRGVAAASAGIFRTFTGSDSWSDELEDWAETTDSSYTHLAVVTRPDKQGRLTTIWAVLAQRLPQFSPELLSNGVQHFYHTCAHCSRGYNGRFYGGDRILLLECPHCEQNYDILAVNTKSRYKRANAFFSHLHTPDAFPKALSPTETLDLIWKRVLDHCEYRNDYDPEGHGPAIDSWQTSAETLERRSGDCEDTSILLADWLISRGIEARVVIGETDDLQGHAWCVAQVEGEEYLLETTIDSDEISEGLPRVSDMRHRYHPEYLFDRQHLYFPSEGINPREASYFQAAHWQGVDYQSTQQLSVFEPAPPVSLAAWFTKSATKRHESRVVASLRRPEPTPSAP